MNAEVMKNHPFGWFFCFAGLWRIFHVTFVFCCKTEENSEFFSR